MSWSWTLYRYLARHFAGGIATVYAGFLLLAFSIDMVNLLNRTSENNVSTSLIAAMALLHLPVLGIKMLPFAVLLGGVFCFVRLSRNQELVATRAAGVSAWDFLLPPLAVAVALGVAVVLAATPVSSVMLNQFAALEAKYVKGQASQLSVSANGLWLRQGTKQAQSVIHALSVSDQGVHLEDVIVFNYGAKDHLEGRIDAKSAQLGNGAWMLKDAWVSGPDGIPKHYDLYPQKTTLTPTQIQESFASPDTLSFWALPQFIQAAENAGFSAIRYRLYLYSLLTLPVLLAAMVFMAASFSLKLSRAGGLGRVVLISALSGFGVYFFTDLTRALGQTAILPAWLAATAPALAAILIGMTLVFHQEDG
ncbi:lipopolysaccharide export system permease protein [Rhizomicrobium palustre]|uniref:Lipopolysaccharide export system permease protein n=1 Tax=Rhizomicrobium palustre TaxID=189966 RepID=A0A846MV09_9PROT|nr:LPS export ABC transporter permease LptG [Rhizomicrobium palustre]NIK87021.1 lipopolysaccharide export system permease protein [Rhizomicrobium palustre]